MTCKILANFNCANIFWTMILNSGIDHNQKERTLKSKISESLNNAPKHFIYKDHKREGWWHPVVGGCSSDNLGLSNTLSEVEESVAMSVSEPYEVISSGDTLLPLWSDFYELVWIQTIYPIVVWIWSEFSPFCLNFKNIDYMNGLLTVWSHWYITFTAMPPIPNLKIHLFIKAP